MSIYTLRVTERFEAAHHLRSYHGLPEPVHGHSWRVEVKLTTDELDSEGMAVDFLEVRRQLAQLTSRFHHNDINSVPHFDNLNPTTEHIARWFHERLTSALPDVHVEEVTLWEGPDCSASYRLA